MEITLTIDDKPVKFKSSGAVTKRYKMQFQRDFFADISSFGLAMQKEDIKSADSEKAMQIMSKIDFDLFLDIAWVFAKTADNAIPDPLTWLDGFETFPIMEILPDLQDLIARTIGSKKK
ncbi:hypothetical protein [Lysinibacillus sp. G4S2]|uniref:hypothetical protein n=1 Tax=Lysinibacillus sp. G4S2 TaxID=3055859 RepID=UPI0025A2FB87|nr:hypothetical protein [Lysinibacillus sp. G4S2]MDM5245762.1 hypothetical protein [Lysinibacillus sp. G4S2]